MKLVYIHGRDQQDKIPAAMEKEWTDALKTGLSKQQLTLPEETEIIVPFYGDLLRDLLAQLEDQEDIEGLVARGSLNDSEEIAFYKLLKEIADQAGITPEQIDELDDANLKERGWEHHRPVLLLLRAIDRYTGIGAGQIKQKTYDVFCYLTYDGIRRQVNELVKAAIPKEPVVVVAHSLGSVVAYNILYDLSAEYTITKLITVGSPLGVKWIKEKIKTPLKMPPRITGGWFNAFDRRDIVALNELNAGNFNISPPIVNFHGVNNFTENRHGIAGYLSDPTIAKVIFEALKS